MARFGVKEVAEVTFYNLLNNKPELFLDTLKMSNLENAAESVYATGGQGAGRLVGWDFGRTANFVLQDALLNPKAIAMQVGTQLEKKVETLYEREVAISVDDGEGNSKITLSNEPKEGSIQVIKSQDGYSHDEEVESASVTVVANEVTIPSASLAVGEQVVIYYEIDSSEQSEVITIKSDQFGGYYRVVGKTFWRNEKTGEDEKVQIVIPRAKISSSFTLTMQPDGDPSVFDFNLDVFKSPDNTDMVKIIRY